MDKEEIDKIADEALSDIVDKGSKGGVCYSCTGTRFQCGTYNCGRYDNHSCARDFRCTVKFTENR